MRKEFAALREHILVCLALVEAFIGFGKGKEIEQGVFEEGVSVARPTCARRSRARRAHLHGG